MSAAFFILFIAAITAGGLIAAEHLWAPLGDPQAMLRYVLRITIILPFGTALIVGAVHVFDLLTPNNWLVRIYENTLACGIVVAALIYCLTWLVVQG